MNSFLSLQTTCVLLLWHFFVWLTRLMRNVRHDCLLNPLICGPDPINHDTASSNKFPALYQVYLAVTMSNGEVGGLLVAFLFANCFHRPTNCSAGCFRRAG